MRLTTVLLSAMVLGLGLTEAHQAAACGGCFVPPEESTQVTGHKMLVSISNTETTLWDQIEYTGAPSSFAWVLPVRGLVDIGLSSDLLFAFLGNMTHVDVVPPPLNCPSPPWCMNGQDEAFGDAASTGTGGYNDAGGVSVVAQEVVGPYETVQLQSDDPAALKDWLTSHNYNLPPEIAPIVDAYVADHFNFLALKLIPGEGIESMRPVRVTTPGAGIGLPLRMVAAGTGAVTPITLWVMSEGRYETANFPSFEIDPADIVWDWDTSSSNYTTLKTAGFEATGGLGWLVESAHGITRDVLDSQMTGVAASLPEQSGYGDETISALDDCTEDLTKVFGSLDPGAIWLTRLNAQLPRVALAEDLELGAAPEQVAVSNYLQATQWTGTFPTCPEYPPCDSDTTTTSGGDSDEPKTIEVSGGSCAVGGGAGAPALIALFGAAVGLAFARRRRS